MNYNVRIDDNFLRGDHVDGEVLQHTDLNELENVAKTAINANYEDIQKLQDGTLVISNSEKLNGASLSKFADETLQNSDTKVPTSSQVKQYVDGAISNIDLGGYYTKREVDDTFDSHNLNLDTNHKLEAVSRTYAQYQTDGDTSFISKGTLDNVLLNKPIKFLIGTDNNPVNFDTLSAGFYKIEGSTIIGEGLWTDVNSYFAVGPLGYEDDRRIKRILDLGNLNFYFVERTGAGPNYSYILRDYPGLPASAWDINKVYADIDDAVASINDEISFVEENMTRIENEIPIKTSELTNDSGYITKSVNNLENYYTKTEINTNLGNYYTKSEINTSLNNYYTKSEIDNELDDYYTKTEIDTNLDSYYDKTEIDESQDSQNTQIEELQEENDYLNSIIDQIVPKVSGSGEYITLNDTIEAKMDIDLYAKLLSQFTTTGKNKFASFSSLSQSGINFSVNSDGSYNISGTSTAQVNNYIYVNIEDSGLITNETYTLSSNQALPGYIYIIVEKYNGNTWASNVISPLSNTYQTRTETIDLSGGTRIRFGVRIESGHTFNITNLKIQLEKSSTATDWERYTGGIPAPSPSFPQDIHTISGSNKLKVEGKNRFNNKLTPFYTQYTTVQILPTGIRTTSTVNGSSASNNNVQFIMLDVKDLEGQKVTLSAHAKSSSTNKGMMYMRLVTSNGGYTSNYGTQVTNETLDGDISKSYTIPSGIGEYHYILVALYSTRNSAVSIGDYVDYTNLQLEVSASKTDYEPYTGEEANIDLGDIECGSIGNYENIPIRTSGKNKMGYPDDFNTTINGINVKQSIGIYDISGTSTSAATFVTEVALNAETLIEEGDYLHIGNTAVNPNLAMILVFKDGSSDSFGMTALNRIYQFTSSYAYIGKTLSKIRFYCNSSGISTNLQIKPMILSGVSTETDYEPYGNGDWYLKQEIGEYILDGTTGHSFLFKHGSITSDTKGFYQFNIPNRYNSSSGSTEYALSNYFKFVGGNADSAFNNNTSGIWWEGGTAGCCYAILEETSLTNANAWLTTHNTTIKYVLATPTYTPITGTLAEQLDNIKSKLLSQKGQTSISQVNNDLPFEISVSAYKTLESLGE